MAGSLLPNTEPEKIERGNQAVLKLNSCLAISASSVYANANKNATANC